MCLINDKGNYVTDNMATAQTFKTKFARNFSHTSLPTTAIKLDTPSGQPLFIVSFQDTHASLKAAPNSAPGPDGIPDFLLRLLASSLALSLSIIYKSLTQGVLPSCWKTAIVVPIYKSKGAKTYPSNYRPISAYVRR